ncbi:unnamed protein product [Diamesa hyperborea]
MNGIWIVLVVSLIGGSVIAEPDKVTSDIDVFNKNFNRQQHSARNLVYRVYDVIPAQPQPSWKASASIVSENPEEQNMSGEVTFKQWNINQPITVKMNISGVPAGKHSVHIHAFGDISEGCKSTGPHFRSSIIGNVEAKEDGNVEVEYESFGLHLFGLSGILGRSIVIHEKPSQYLKYPDLFTPGSQFLDNAVSFQSEEDTVGERLACGIITITNNLM